ncbi:hypothetical protein [Phenylobacterium sp.]|uniref:hypothetical protein n=1 Tax=Phenylobacterium sp. TaxID=1871053 RepID=UPI002731762C|nr:hypothetical protein [Phenylobacterium sp.]MDP1618735.1 hypothetical protein [Phenylobacterium sp.]MDP1987244.1 hypothetical protein [Phenylobacterium sp.]
MARLRTLFALGLTASLAAATAQAAEGRLIHPADTDKDDRISRQEWVAYKLPAAEFDKADTNGDGLINGPEFVAWRQAQG